MDIRAAAKKIDIYKVFFVFLLCAFIGWVFETAQTAIFKHEFSNRGYLFALEPLPHYLPFLKRVPLIRRVPLLVGLPLIEMYGFGGLLTVFGFRKLEKRPVLLFLVGTAVLTLFELLGSYFCTLVLHRRFWDYSHQFLNFEGRISALSALAWGVGTLLAVKLLAPLIDKLYPKIRGKTAFKIIACLLMAGALVCGLCKYWWFADTLAQ